MALQMAASTMPPTPVATMHATTRKKLSGVAKSTTSRKRKSDEHEEAKFNGTAKSTKPFAGSKSRNSKAGNAEDIGLENLEITRPESSLDDSVILIDERSLGLDKSVARRRSWTPVAEDCRPERDLGSTENYTSPTVPPSSTGHGLGSLSSKYSYLQSTASNHTANMVDEIKRKTTRRKIELGHAPLKQMSDLEPESKPKPKPKKKPRTITEKATELYRRDFGIEEQGSAEPQTKASTSGKDTTKKRRSRKSKTALINTLPSLPLLSPSSARIAFESQERIFGTCSQLAREDSPTTIRDLQTALKVSLDGTPKSNATLGTSASTSQSSGRQSGVGLLPSAKKLWEAASRDLDGKMTMPETIDLTDSPHNSSRLNLRPSPTAHTPMNTIPAEVHMYPEPLQPLFPERPPTISISSSEIPPAPAPDTSVAQPIEASPDDRGSNRQETMPDYEQWPDEELKAAIKGYGFKAMRNRKNMIARLKKCWESLHPDSTSATAMTKDVHPASDLQEATLPGKLKSKQASRKSKASTSKTIRALDNELTTDSPLPQAQMSTDRERLFTAIQKAITSSPLTSDPQNLSWHEKILLYDPLVIEDLTRWLNEGHLTRVGVDEEVAPVLVRDWCESRSICCLWRLNLRGAVRSRY